VPFDERSLLVQDALLRERRRVPLGLEVGDPLVDAGAAGLSPWGAGA